MDETGRTLSGKRLDAWLAELRQTDQAVFGDVESKRAEVTSETAVSGVITESLGAAPSGLEFETIVLRTGRPVLPIRGDRVSTEGAFIESDSIAVVKRVREHEHKFARFIPSVGRIDVANSMFAIDWVGTGWLVAQDVVVTNRHVAELVAAWNGGRFVFRPGKNGARLGISIDFKHEVDDAGEAAFEVESVIWIERDPFKADIALLKLKTSPGANRMPVPLAAADAAPGKDVVVIGYPARATPKAIPEQELMERIFAGRYDIKRIAPGQVRVPSPDKWSTHDCTTLGGNSGSAVIDMRSGEAVALHFAGAFLIDNYAVPASTVRKYLADRPWESPLRPSPVGRDNRDDGGGAVTRQSRTGQAPARVDMATGQAGGAVSFTIPLHISVSLGAPVFDAGSGRTSNRVDTRPATAGGPRAATIEDAVGAARDQFTNIPGVISLRQGYLFLNGAITQQRCVVVAAEAHAIDRVRSTVGESIDGFPVDVRPASAEDLAESALAPNLLQLEASGGGIGYDDNNRTTEKFSLEPMQGQMEVICHVGPERSWPELQDFIAGARRTLVTAMYEFNAKHIADAVQRSMDEGVKFDATLDGMLAEKNETDRELFNQKPTFRRWETRFGNRFSFVYVPEGVGGLIWNAYHIKVTVRDSASFWLSSGNWKPSSQPKNSARVLSDDTALLPGNREWHVVVKEREPVLAQRFQSHIQADHKFTLEHAERETISATVWVDVPIAALEAAVEEARVPRKRMPTQTLSGSMRVQPLLTPDHKGAAYCKPVLSLIRSAEQQLWFQIPYITPNPNAPVEFLDELVAALVETAGRVDDFRLILRSDTFSSLQKSLEALQDAGLDTETHVRQIPNSHTKGMIVDRRHTLIGSHNWSGPGVTINRDASLIFFDNPEVAAYYAEAFDIDWERAREPRVREAPALDIRLATTEAPPAGYKRVPLESITEL